MLAAFFQHLDAGKFLPFQQFQKGAAAGGNVADLGILAGAVHRRIGVAAADDGEGIGVGHRRDHGEGAAGKGVHLEDAHRAVPDDGLGVLQRLGEEGDGGRTDVEPHPPFGDLLDGGHLGFRFGIEAGRQPRSRPADRT